MSTTPLFGHNPEAVLELLRHRRSGQTDPDRKTALIVEGGGMRGVLSAGSLLAVDLMQHRQSFDNIYATSAGGVNAAYFLSGQGSLGITVYFDSINNTRFFNPLRLGKIVDVDFVYDHIVPEVKPLDEQAIRDSKTRLFLSVTDAGTAANQLIDVQHSAEPVNRILKASSALPILYNRTVTIDGNEYIDGGISDSIPIEQAVAHGCTDILCLLTRPESHVSEPPSKWQSAVFHALMGKHFPALGPAFATMHKPSNRSRRFAFGKEKLDGINIATISTDGISHKVSRMTMNREDLVNGAYAMGKKTFQAFSENTERLEREFELFKKA